MLRIGIVAGEASGDYLAANLVQAIRKTHPDITIEGIGGPKLEQCGCRSIFPMEKLAVMGITEVIGSYLELSRIRKSLVDHFINNPPDIFIGVDLPDFNIGLEAQLKRHGIKTIHYVSPSVWAWRGYRIKKIKQAVDLMLTLFPFESGIYRDHDIPVTCVGHPLADQISLMPDRKSARTRLGIAEDVKLIAIMPGSRRHEREKLLTPFLHAAQLMYRDYPDIQLISSVLDEQAVKEIKTAVSGTGNKDLPLTIFKDRAHDVLEAADIVLLASGTITLEAMLYKRPMVVAYKMNWLSYLIIRALIKVDYVALPNLLANSRIVPECLQGDCTPEQLYIEMKNWLTGKNAVDAVEKKFIDIHEKLKLNANDKAARAVLSLL